MSSDLVQSKATPAKHLLILGGSGFFSGTLAREALREGWQVTIVTRGLRPVDHNPQLKVIIADRNDGDTLARRLANETFPWDLVVDCIGFEPAHARQDLECFSGKCRRFVFISTDFVYDPSRRSIPQPEEGPFFNQSGYGGAKRTCEQCLEDAGYNNLPWTILRPAHIYGPGSKLGCLPEHGRDPDLISHMKAGKPLRLVGGGHFVQSPIYAADLARVTLACAESDACVGRIINVPGPDTVESRAYYAHIAEALGVELRIETIPVTPYLNANPEKANFLCHRSYTTQALREAKLPLPSTSLRDGLRNHVAFLEKP